LQKGRENTIFSFNVEFCRLKAINEIKKGTLK